MPVLPERDYQKLDLYELLALVDADKLVREWRASAPVQRVLPLFADRSGCAAA